MLNVPAGICNRKRRRNIWSKKKREKEEFICYSFDKSFQTYGFKYELAERKRGSDIHGWQTHSSKWVGDSQPDGGDQRRHEAEGQETKDGQREDGAGQGKDAPKAHVILKQTGHQSHDPYWLTLDRKRSASLLWECPHWLRGPANCHKPLRRCRPPPSDCSRCTCPGWTYWIIKQSSTVIYLKVIRCSGLKDRQRKLHLYDVLGPRPMKGKAGICIAYVWSVLYVSVLSMHL